MQRETETYRDRERETERSYIFSIPGYARYGSAVDQVITVTVSKYSTAGQLIIVQIVNVTLCIGILLT